MQNLFGDQDEIVTGSVDCSPSDVQVAKIAVDLSLDRLFDYFIPSELVHSVQVGSHVEVPFGPRRTQGFVVGLGARESERSLKKVIRVIDKEPLISADLMKLAEWMSEYYVAPLELAIRTMLPSAVRKPASGFKKQLYAVAGADAQNKDILEQLCKKAPKQAAVLDLLTATGKPMLVSGIVHSLHTTSATLRSLEKKGLVTITNDPVARDPLAGREIMPTRPLPLMDQQKAAYDSIVQSMDDHESNVSLLYGVTGSGKTEVYLQVLARVLEAHKGAIILVPEISLTPQTVERFRARFGTGVAVLHSHLSTGERHDEWHRVRSGDAQIVIGARSALFAPVRDLGLIVVDEEHETSYKQEEAPRYNARDVAVMRGRIEKCPVVLGSATPSLESWYNASKGKYALLRMPHRIDHRRMPVMRVVDMRMQKNEQGKRGIFSADLIEAVRGRLSRAEQVILFLNRRGFSTSLVCPSCGFVVECEQCSVSMTYHKSSEKMVCHMCGAQRDVPRLCPNPECRDPAIRYSGTGTQKVEEVVRKLFPHANVVRMDSDTTGAKNAHEKILSAFRVGKIDILIGTQMIAKGLHFPNVTLVGVVFADVILHMPDFRAGQRTFEMLTQVAGRAGRGDILGEVVVQTFTPFHPAIQAARRMDYEVFADQEISFRSELGYPPCKKMICITMKGKNEEEVKFSSELFEKRLRADLDPSIGMVGPVPSPIARLKGDYRYQILLRGASVKRMVEPLKKRLKEFTWPKDVRCIPDVDAFSVL